MAQEVDSIETTYVLDIGTPLTMVLAETTGEDAIYYLHGLDLVAQSDGSSTEYFTYDALGSVRQLTDDEANPLLTQTYDPYGTVYASVGAGASSYGFSGEQVDANGLVYLRARYYQPGMGRFLNTDPSRKEMNPYLYSAGNPVMFTDPSGLICINGVDKWPYAVLPCSSGVDLGCAFQSMSEFYDLMTKEHSELLLYAHYLAAEGLLGGKKETYTEYLPIMTRITNPSQYYDRGEEHLFIWDIHEAGLSSFEVFLDASSLGLSTVPTSLADDFADDAAVVIVREAPGVEVLDGAGLIDDAARYTDDYMARSELLSLLEVRLRQEYLSTYGPPGKGYILVDEGMSPAVAQALRDEGYNAQHIIEVFDARGMKDSQIMQLADAIDALVVTRDRGHDIVGGFSPRDCVVPESIQSEDNIVKWVQLSLE